MYEFIVGVSIIGLFLIAVKLAINHAFKITKPEYEKDYGTWR